METSHTIREWGDATFGEGVQVPLGEPSEGA